MFVIAITYSNPPLAYDDLRDVFSCRGDGLYTTYVTKHQAYWALSDIEAQWPATRGTYSVITQEELDGI